MSSIEIGIDLGTTNSEVAILNNGQIQIVKNNLSDEYTPSVFGITKSNREIVGKTAFNNLGALASDENIKNTRAEIKRIMGTSENVYFPQNGKYYKPEEISAKILEALKNDALQANPNINTDGVVITVPTHFATLQSEATKRAGILAGFKHVVLLQEPIAASMAFGFNNTTTENWIVYDLGGGTFDVAVMSSKDGTLSVLGHNGDNFLGGKDIDNLIIDKLVTPEITKFEKYKDYSRLNLKYSTLTQRIKTTVEQAKIQLSRTYEVQIDFEYEDLFISIPLLSSVLENICSNLITQTINLAEKTIIESGINKYNISKVLFIGGPTQLPFIKQRVSQELGIPADNTIDPTTAVAKGACIYAASQQIPSSEQQRINNNDYTLYMEYESLSSSDSELLVGKVNELAEGLVGYYILISNNEKNSLNVKVEIKNGKFITELPLIKNKINSFTVYLYDPFGNQLPIAFNQNKINITQGISIIGTPLPNSIGVTVLKTDSATGEAHHEADWFFRKSDILPLTRKKTYKTVRDIYKGDTQNALPVYIFEGESEQVDCNTYICELKISGDMVPFDLPKNSDIDITISVDESREVFVHAYIPSIDVSLQARATVYAEDLYANNLRIELEKQKNKFKQIKDSKPEVDNSIIEMTIEDLENILLSNPDDVFIDTEELRAACAKLKKIKIDIDELSRKNNFEELSTRFDKLLHSVQLVCTHSNADISQTYMELMTRGEYAINTNNPEQLLFVLEQAEPIYNKIILNDRDILINYLSNLIDNYAETITPDINFIYKSAVDAYKNNNILVLQNCILSLFKTLSINPNDEMQKQLSGITC
ncbi:MAG: Hsp70 family protein [Alphaproteobacteria bacterium]|nr:Hsp70 family protein [Alphaproteobacteria bacterium]